MKQDSQQLQAQLNTLLGTKHTLALATLDEKNMPNVGLIPFLYHEQAFYILISELAVHTQNLKVNKQASLLIHLGDQSTNNPFTDQRVSFQVQAHILTQASQKSSILELMQQKLGKTVSLLANLNDFSLVQLLPENGQLVVGFGAAYRIDMENFELIHIDEAQISATKNDKKVK